MRHPHPTPCAAPPRRPVARTLTAALAALGLLAASAPPAQAATVNISGQIQYTDLGGGTFDLRSAEVELWDSNVGFDSQIGTLALGNNGNYSFTVDNADTVIGGGTIDPYIVVRTRFGSTNGFDVFDDSSSGDPSWQQASAPINNITGDTVINQTYNAGTSFGQAAAVFDAIVQANFYAGIVRPGLPSVSHLVRTDHPASEGAETAFYSPGSDQVNIGNNLAHAWDVINHEYGHFLADIDNLDNSPGGAHAFGISNITGGTVGSVTIPALGKDAGTRLAWGEGLADYISSAVHAVGGFNMPAIPTVNDQQYTHRSTVAGNQFTVPIEGNSVNDGEGDEAPIMRILWDIADPANEAHDQIAIGHDSLYQRLDEIAGLVRLDQVWDHFFANTGDLELPAGMPVDQRRALLGDIFETYDVSPDPTGPIVGGTIDVALGSPIFNWVRNNEDANDEFDLVIFNDDFTNRILEIDVPGDVTNYTLTAGEWQTLKDAGLGLRNFVVVGTDTDTFATGPYWSGAEQFTVIPEPATVVLLGLGLAMMIRRRRGA